MAIDGTYGMVYCGFTGLGVAVFTVSNGRMEGRSWDGGRWIGTAIETANGKILVKLTQEVPPGTRLTHGSSPQDAAYSLGHGEELPPLFGDGQPVKVRDGTTTIMIKQIPDDYLTRPTSEWRRIWSGS